MSNPVRTLRPNFRLLFGLLLSGLTAFGVKAQTVYALSASDLIAFNAQTPASLISKTAITGVLPGHQLMGIDFRPATGQLYALGYNSVLGAAEVYTINPETAVATPVGGGAVMLMPGIADLSFDFNPTVDRIRVTGSNGANYRLHPVTGAIAATDGNLAFAAADVNAGATPNIGSVAYTNSYLAATSTTLYNYDFALNILTTQNPPNNGTLNTVGSSGLSLNAIDQSVDLDIYFDPTTLTNRAFLAANTGLSINDDLYSVNLTTGAVTLIGTIGTGHPVRDIAVKLQVVTPGTQTGDLIYALTSNNNLISFDTDQPDVVRSLVPVTGIAMGQVLSGLDFRPATGELYTLGYNTTNGEARLYTINPATGAATAIGAAPVTLATGLGKVGFDFNPTVDRVRVTSSSNANYRLHPTTGALAFTDTNLAFAAGDVNAGANPSIGASAYTNSFNGSMMTTLYNYDDSLNLFTTQAPPNNGTLNTVGASGITVNLADPSTDLDILYDATSLQNRAYFVANVTGGNDNLYSVDLASGQISLIGAIGLGTAVTDIAAFLRTKITTVCTADVSASAAVGSTTAIVTYAAPTATTTCATGGITVTLVSGPASGSVFPTGDTDIVYAIADACGNKDTCRFTVTVDAAPCDSKSLGCLRFDILGISKTLNGDESYRIRVTNNCTSALTYVAFEVPDGITPVSPSNNSTWTSDNGNAYTVRNPNFSPFYSVRFKTQAGSGISGGQSDVFEYALPAQADVLYLYAFVRLADGSGTGVHLNTFDCAIQPYSDDNRPSGDATDRNRESEATGFTVYPNPSTGGQIFADLSDWAGQNVTLTVTNATGQAVQRQEVEAVNGATLVSLPNSLSNGLYYLRLTAADGTQQVRRFVVQR